MNENAGKPYRARLGFAALMGAVVLVVGAKAATGHGEQPSALVALPATAGASRQPSMTGSSPTPTSTSGDDGSFGSSSSGSGSSGSSSGSGSSGSLSSSGSSGSGSSGTAATRTVTGDAVSTRYGSVQVQIVLNGKKITDVVALQLPDRERRDIEINDQAVPILRQEVLNAQSAQIDTVSGASYTSYGYARSVQSALDKAGV